MDKAIKGAKIPYFAANTKEMVGVDKRNALNQGSSDNIHYAKGRANNLSDHSHGSEDERIPSARPYTSVTSEHPLLHK